MKLEQIDTKFLSKKDWHPWLRGVFADMILDYQEEYKSLTGHYYKHRKV